MIAEGPRMETDAATVGTVLHSVIEHELNGNPFEDEATAIEWAAADYVRELEVFAADGALYSMATFGDHTKALKALSWLVRSWYHCPERTDLLYRDIEYKTEWKFDLPFRDIEVRKSKNVTETIPVFLAGTSDLVANNRVYDWKTAGSEYKQWELQRWGRQPDVYTWAAAQAGLVTPDRDGLYYFDFKVFVRRQEIRLPDTVTVKRSANHWAWLEVIVTRLVNMYYQVGLETGWPLDDQHVLCSPKFCSFWSECKGKLIDAERGWA